MSQEVRYVLPGEKVQSKRYCCMLLDELSKGINTIKQEFQRLQMLENEYNKKLQTYLEISRRVDKKLCNLWDISSRIIQSDYNRGMDIFTFTNKVVKTWQDGNSAIAKEVQNVMLVSYTNPNAPLKVVVEKIVANSNMSKDAFQKIRPHIFCLGRFNSIYTEAVPLFGRLRNGNLVLQYFLSVSRGIPHLTSLDNSVEQYISTLPPSLLSQVYQATTRPATVTTSSVPQNLAPQKKTENEEFSAYSRVVQLLNGELLAEENPLHHHSNIQPLVSHEYIPPDMIPETANTVAMGGDVQKKPELQNETTKESRGIFRNEFSPKGTTISLVSAPQKAATGITRNEPQRCVMVLGRTAGINSKLTGSSTLSSSSVSNIMQPKMAFQLNDSKAFIRRRQVRVDAETSDLKPIKIPKLKLDLLTPLP